MAGVACPACGTVNAPGSVACARCGVGLPRVVGAGPLPAGPPPPPYAPGPPPFGAPTPPYAWGPPAPGWAPWPPPRYFRPEVDGVALSRAELASIVGLVAGLVGIASAVLIGPLLGSSLGHASTTGSPIPASTIAFWSVTSLLGVGLSLLTWMLMRSSFVKLRDDDPQFGTPSLLVVIGVVGLLIAAIGLPALLSGVGSLLQCNAQNLNQTTPTPTNCFATAGGDFVAGLGLLLLGGVLAFLGLIGMCLGIWRIGTRFDSTLLHVGAILWWLIPFVGWLLVWLGCREARRKVPNAPMAPRFIP